MKLSHKQNTLKSKYLYYTEESANKKRHGKDITKKKT